MSEKVLVAGPWVGEFGWELFTWQGYIRSLSEKFDKTIVLSRPSSKFLYTDFCDIFIDAHPPDGIADSYFMHGLDVAGFFKNILKENNIKLEKVCLFSCLEELEHHLGPTIARIYHSKSTGFSKIYQIRKLKGTRV